ncbi:MAG: radical SAM family heme chaperone HemW [Nitrospirae bacterium]|nr:MAG: radical SAM family heme chaperone HemW [Nitrospirota bacterium]
MPDFLYIHIPFCARKCIYCDFLSFPYDRDLALGYIRALCTELTLRKEGSGPLRSVYIGGGTPTSLPEDAFEMLFNVLREQYAFSSDAEITVEANPGSVDASKFRLLADLGVNRISIGIQSFIDDELKTLQRIHSSAEAVRAVETAEKVGIRNISVDLMYGIPGQTASSFQRSLSTACSLAPVHISTYELTPEERTPLFSEIRSGKLLLPEEEEVIGMYACAIDYLTSRGFSHYEISNFAVPGYESRHNLNYWDRGEYLGAGAGAHSFRGGSRARNTSDMNRYIHDLERSILPEEDSAIVSPEEALEELIFLGLRKTQGIALSAAEALGTDLVRSSGELIEQGYLETDSRFIRLTDKGLVLSNMVIVRLMKELGL